MKVYVIGGANIDISGKANAGLKLKDSNPGKIALSFGGVARNIAENLARLGIPVKFISAFSDDLLSLNMLKHLNSLKIDTSNSLIVKGATTATYLALLNKGNDMEVAISDTSILSKLDKNYLQSIIKKIKPKDILVIDTNLETNAIDYIFKHCKGKIFVDPISTTKTKKIKTYLNQIYAIKPNILEAEIIVNHKILKEKDVIEAAKKISKLGVKKTFISLGKMGAYGFADNAGELVGTKKVSIKSATGAGDAFMAGLVVSEIRNYNLKETLRYATGCALIALASELTVSNKITDQAVKRLIRGIKNEN
jgi:pseudouridine kinase